MTLICDLDALTDPGSRGFSIDTVQGRVDCMLVRRGETIAAYRNNCPHTGAPLDWLPGQFLDPEGEMIQCVLHGALFRISNGECVVGPFAGEHLDPISIRVAEGRVWSVGTD